MPNPGYRRGSQRERDVVDDLRDRGWIAFRTPASKGCCDVVAMRRGETISAGSDVLLIEVKTNKGRPFDNFRPNDRQRLLREAKQAGAEPLLYWWPGDRKGPRVIPASEWPQKKTDCRGQTCGVGWPE
jgi:Holliday junction resolvase